MQGRRSRGGLVGPFAPAPPTFWAKISKKEDYHFTFEDTESPK